VPQLSNPEFLLQVEAFAGIKEARDIDAAIPSKDCFGSTVNIPELSSPVRLTPRKRTASD
jgi:hypothetical protein